MRILFKWYFNELLGYLIMPFTSIPVIIANIKTSHNVFFSPIEFFYVEIATKRKQKDSIFKSYVVVVVALLFYVHGKHLRSCRDGQLN